MCRERCAWGREVVTELWVTITGVTYIKNVMGLLPLLNRLLHTSSVIPLLYQPCVYIEKGRMECSELRQRKAVGNTDRLTATSEEQVAATIIELTHSCSDYKRIVPGWKRDTTSYVHSAQDAIQLPTRHNIMFIANNVATDADSAIIKGYRVL